MPREAPVIGTLQRPSVLTTHIRKSVPSTDVRVARAANPYGGELIARRSQ
jgi:hypothetical protein